GLLFDEYVAGVGDFCRDGVGAVISTMATPRGRIRWSGWRRRRFGRVVAASLYQSGRKSKRRGRQQLDHMGRITNSAAIRMGNLATDARGRGRFANRSIDHCHLFNGE